MYEPHPENTDHIELPAELSQLCEDVSRNIHDVWARRRIDEGWQWGPVRDDRKKTTPCLVPYEELSESEKDYDRSTVIQTLKIIIALGFKIEKKPEFNTTA